MMHRVLLLPSLYPTSEKPLVGTFVREQAAALSSHGIAADVVFVEAASLRGLSPARVMKQRFQLEQADEAGVWTVRRKGWNLNLRAVRGGRLWSAMMRQLVRRYVAERGKPELIHAHNALWAGHAAAELARELGIPFVLTEHSSSVPRPGAPSWPYARQAYGAASVVMAVSFALARRVEQTLPESSVRVVPNLVNTGFFTVPPRPRDRSPFTFVSAGHLVVGKGFDVLLAAFAEAFRHDTRVRLRIGGDGPERRTLASLISRLGLASRVEMLGGVDRAQVRDLLWSGNAFALASRGETFGMVYAEALATGIPVAGTRCGGPEEFVGEADGCLVAPDHVSEFAQALRKVREGYYDPATLRGRIVDRFAPGVVVARLKQIYAEALQRPLAVEAKRCGTVAD